MKCKVCKGVLNVFENLCFSCAARIARETEEERRIMYRNRDMSDPFAAVAIFEWKHPDLRKCEDILE